MRRPAQVHWDNGCNTSLGAYRTLFFEEHPHSAEFKAFLGFAGAETHISQRPC